MFCFVFLHIWHIIPILWWSWRHTHKRWDPVDNVAKRHVHRGQGICEFTWMSISKKIKNSRSLDPTFCTAGDRTEWNDTIGNQLLLTSDEWWILETDKTCINVQMIWSFLLSLSLAKTLHCSRVIPSKLFDLKKGDRKRQRIDTKT